MKPDNTDLFLAKGILKAYDILEENCRKLM